MNRHEQVSVPYERVDYDIIVIWGAVNDAESTVEGLHASYSLTTSRYQVRI